MKTILHIAAHLGGGAGKAISGLVKNTAQYRTVILLLEEPANKKYYDICIENNIEIVISSQVETIKKLAAESDIIVLNWWGHPLFVNVFNALSDVKARIVLWSHVNGLHYPYLSYYFLNTFDGLMFTSPCTYENTLWTDEERKNIMQKSSVVYGMGDFEPEFFSHKTDYQINDKCRIGYTGTLSFGKMNSCFPAVCDKIHQSYPECEFLFYGKSDEEFADNFHTEYVIFKGYSDSIEKSLTELDLFCYPLVEENYATTENSLIEAMAAGLPIVVLNNPPERSIISDNETGLIADNENEFTELTLKLISDLQQRERIGKTARKAAIEKYSVKKNVLCYTDCIGKALQAEKRTHDFIAISGTTPWEFFNYFCGEDSVLINDMMCSKADVKLPAIYFENSKGSPKHFYSYYPDDKNIQNLLNRINKQIRGVNK